MRRTIMVTAAIAVVTFITVGPGIAGSPDPIVNASPHAKEKVLAYATSIGAPIAAPSLAELDAIPYTAPPRPIAVAGPDIKSTTGYIEIQNAVVVTAPRSLIRDHPAFLGVTVVGVAVCNHLIIGAKDTKLHTRAGPPLSLAAVAFAKVGIADASAHLLC